MVVDFPRKHLQLDASVHVDRLDPCHRRVGVLATDDRVVTADRNEAFACVTKTGPEATVIAHPHEVHPEVVIGCHRVCQEATPADRVRGWGSDRRST